MEQFFKGQISRLISTIEAGDPVAITAQLQFCRDWGDGPLLAAATVADAWLNERRGAAVAGQGGREKAAEIPADYFLCQPSTAPAPAPAPTRSKARRRGANDAPLSLPPI